MFVNRNDSDLGDLKLVRTIVREFSDTESIWIYYCKSRLFLYGIGVCYTYTISWILPLDELINIKEVGVIYMTSKHKATKRNNEDKLALIRRLKRVEGQVRGVQNMIEDDRYCIDIIIQISAINAALKQVGFSLLEQHANHCVLHALESGDGEEAVQELVNVIKQYAK